MAGELRFLRISNVDGRLLLTDLRGSVVRIQVSPTFGPACPFLAPSCFPLRPLDPQAPKSRRQPAMQWLSNNSRKLHLALRRTSTLPGQARSGIHNRQYGTCRKSTIRLPSKYGCQGSTRVRPGKRGRISRGLEGCRQDEILSLYPRFFFGWVSTLRP